MTFAPSVEVHAAIVGGLISGGVVLLGVFLAEWLHRRRDRHNVLVDATRTIARALHPALYYLTGESPEFQGANFGSPGFAAQQELREAFVAADTATRPRLTAKRREIRAALDDIMARAFAADLRHSRGIVLTRAEFESFPLSSLTRAVFGSRDFLDEMLVRYSKDG